jgi:DnaJ-class molecular chaperone
MKCVDCDGKGFVEEESGVVSPHIPYEVEIITDICGSCWGKGVTE